MLWIGGGAHASAGFGDEFTGDAAQALADAVRRWGLPAYIPAGWSPTAAIRARTAGGSVIDPCSGWYKAGQAGAVVWSLAMAGAGAAEGAAAEGGPLASMLGDEGGAVGGIPRITPGSLPASEEANLLDSLSHIDSGTKPTSSTAAKWGTQFKNWNEDLPGPSGVDSPFREFRVTPSSDVQGAGPLRLVVNPSTGDVFFTWTRYGDLGHPAFVRIR